MCIRDRFVPLASVADIRIVDGPNQISRENGKRRVVVQANVRGRDIASVVADARATIAKDVRLPAGSYLVWGGQFENLASARERLQLVIPACFVLILMLLYGALGSARDAAIVFTGVPLALVGGVLLLFLRGIDSVSYTHLDVYKRQSYDRARCRTGHYRCPGRG